MPFDLTGEERPTKRRGEPPIAFVRDVRSVGSCNFCSRASTDGIYPYRKVLVIRHSGEHGGGMEARMCRACWRVVKAMAGGVGF